MKRILAVLLVAVMTLGMVACGSINDTDVAILWNGDGVVHVPNSTINAIERAMYIENISYTHYGANGDAAKQLTQAQAAVDAGCAALVVELVDAASAQQIVDIAKAKNVPVVFLGTRVDDSVLASYDKCVAVESDEENRGKIQGEMIGEYLVKNFEDADRNEDGKITYVSFADVAADDVLTAINAALVEAEKPELVFYDESSEAKTLATADAGEAYKAILESYNDENENTVELIITDSDLIALEILVVLQNAGFNSNQLKTHLIPLFTIGSEADYKSYVLKDRPEIPAEFADKDAEKAFKKTLKEYYESKQYLCDLTAVEEEDLAEMIYNTIDVIAAGRIAGTAIADYDSMAIAAAAIVRNFINGAAATEGVDAEWIADGKVFVPYTTSTN